MKILVNASICRKGGAVQVAVNFILNAIKHGQQHDWCFAVSQVVYDTISSSVSSDVKLMLMAIPPSSLFHGRKSRRKLLELERDFLPDVIFSIFAHPYVRFHTKLIQGYAQGFCVCDNKYALRTLSIKERWYSKAIILKEWLLFFMNKHSHYIVETVIARRGLMRFAGVAEEKIHVVPNSYSAFFSNKVIGRPLERNKNEIHILSLNAYYGHKNLEVIPETAAYLKEMFPDLNIIFYLTVNSEIPQVKALLEHAERLGIGDSVINLGPQKLDACVTLYQHTDIVFQPTLLEIFTATYPEAMVMQCPIITTDTDFAREICGDAALFYDPLSAKDAAEKLARVVRENGLAEQLVNNGLTQLKLFPDPDEKFKMQLELIESMAQTIELDK